MNIAFFITAHGLGHAARACAIIEAASQLAPDTRFTLFTSAPEPFLQQSLNTPYALHPLQCDVGMVQSTAFDEDLQATLRAVNEFYPVPPRQIAALARELHSCKIDLVVADIAPLGILAAHTCGLPSVLVENFTWDWIYQGYAALCPDLTHHIHYLRNLFDSATLRIQTEPLCQPKPHLNCARIGPISRKPRTPPHLVKQALHIPPDKPLVLISISGVAAHHSIHQQVFDSMPHVHFVVPGANDPTTTSPNLTLIQSNASLFHPDLVHAADVIIGKIGYSTLSEAYHAGIPFGYIEREHFAESRVLARFAKDKMPGLSIPRAEFDSGTWAPLLARLLAMPRQPTVTNCADQAAQLILTQTTSQPGNRNSTIGTSAVEACSQNAANQTHSPVQAD